MANCKFCGEPVKVTPVFHPECFKQEAQKIAETFCDTYCKYPTMYGDDEDLMYTEECYYCVVGTLLNLGR